MPCLIAIAPVRIDVGVHEDGVGVSVAD